MNDDSLKMQQIDFFYKDGENWARIELSDGSCLDFRVDEDAQIYNYNKQIHEPGYDPSNEASASWTGVPENSVSQDIKDVDYIEGNSDMEPIGVHIPSWVPLAYVDKLLMDGQDNGVPTEFYIKRGSM